MIKTSLLLLFSTAAFSANVPEFKQNTPPPFDADLFHKDDQVFSLHGEFLFWWIEAGALDYALTMNSAAWGPANCYAQGTFQSGTFNGDPGFRISASFFRAPHFWEIKASYTRLTSVGSNQAKAPSNPSEYLTGTWPQLFTGPVSEAKSDLHFNYNVVDFYSDRVFNPNPHLRLRVIGGMTGGWMDQFWKIRYLASQGNETAITNRWSFGGGGLKVGTSVDWYWTGEIFVTATATFSALLGLYNNHSLTTTTYEPAGYNSSLPVGKTKFSDVRSSFVSQFLLGPSYQHNFPNSRIEIFAGYELSIWTNLQEIYRSTYGAPTDPKETWINSSALSLQGLTTRVTYDF